MSDGLPSATITSCAVGPDGMLWIGTWNGLCNYDGYRINSFADRIGEGQVLTSNRIRSLRPVGHGDVYLKTFDDKRYLFHGKQMRYIKVQSAECRVQSAECRVQSAERRVQSAECRVQSAERRVQSAERRVQSNSAQPNSALCTLHSALRVRLTPDSLGSINHTDLDGTRWQIRADGTIGYLRDGGEFVPVQLRGVSGNERLDMRKVVSDTRGNLWFTAEHSLYMLHFRNYSFHHRRLSPEGEAKFFHGDTRAVEPDGNGTVYVGTRQGYLILLDKDAGKRGYLRQNGSLSRQPAKFCDAGIYALFHDSRGKLWIGTRGEGLFSAECRVQSAECRVQSAELGASDIFDINEDTQGRIWIGTYMSGAKVLSPEGELLFSIPLPEGNARKVRRIERGEGDMMILSTADGLFTLSSRFTSAKDIKITRTGYKEGSTNSLLSKDVLHAISNPADGSLLISTMGGGVQTLEQVQSAECRVQSWAARWHSALHPNSALCTLHSALQTAGNVQSFLIDNDGKLWIVGENTILNANRGLVYSSNDWGEETLLSEAKAKLDRRTGNIYVATDDGVIFFNPRDIRKSDFVPPLVFSGVQYQGDERITPLAGADTLFLPVDKHNAVVYFSALDYGDNSRIRYAWRLCEADTAWTYVGSEHCAPLSNLKPGTFTLEVRSTNSNGEWVDNSSTLTIDVEPTFWQTPWANIIYLAILCAILYTIYYIIRLKNETRLEREMLQRKQQLYSQVDTQMRTPLTLISQPVSELLQTEQLSEQGRNILEFVERNASDMINILDKETNVSHPDPFFTRLNDAIEANIANENLKIDDLAQALSCSRSVLYSRVKAQYGISPLELLRDTRIKRACQLLDEHPQMNVSEIAYATGFSEPKYFARSFKQLVGQTPSQYRARKKNL